MAEIYNGRYALADPSSGLTAFSMEGGEINMFGRCTLIRTTQRDSFPIINDAPTELEVEKESNLANVILNGTIGILTGIVLGACAVALIAAAGVATGGMALPCLIAAVPFMVASTAAICTTVGTVENDLRTGYKREPIEFFNTLMDNTMAAYTAGATIAGVLAVAPSAASYLGTCAAMEYGASFFTKTVVPAIIKTGVGALATAKCAFSISDMDANTTHYNWLLDKVFDNDNELYEDCESLVDIMCEGIIAYGGLLPVINPFSDDMEGVHGKNNQKNTKDNAGIDDIGDTSKKGKQSISDADMPDDTQIQKYSHTVNPDGADGEKSGNGKAAVSLGKDAGSTIETGQSGKGDSSYNNYNTEQWGKNKISEQPEDKDNTTDDEWYEEGVVLECHIDYYSNENGSIDEDDEYADIRVTNADIDAYRKAKGIEKILDPKTGIPLNTIAIGRTNIPGLENIDFVGRSSSVRKAMNDPTLDNDPDFKNRSIKAPYSGTGSGRITRHAEEDLMAHFEKEIDERGLRPEEIEGTLFIHQSNYNGVCSACTAGVPIISNSTNEGIFMQLTKKYPKLKIVVTSDTRYGVPRGTGTLYFTLLDGKVTNWSKR